MKIPEKLLHVYQLALDGVGGEKENAEQLLQKLLQKYNITLEDLERSEKPSSHVFEVHSRYERKLMVQIAYKVLQKRPQFYHVRTGYSNRISPTKYSLTCTEAQFIEIQFLLDFYIETWKKEVESLMGAFIQKHELYATLDGDVEPTKMSEEDYIKMVTLMQGMDDAVPYLQIEEGTE